MFLRLGSRALVLLLALVASSAGAVVYFLAPSGGSEGAKAHAGALVAKTPSAEEFARNFVGTTNAFAAANGEARRIGNVDCVQASPGRYMCSYATKRPGAPAECHVMQARWTPNAASTITVTLAGRAGRCGTLREALRSLG